MVWLYRSPFHCDLFHTWWLLPVFAVMDERGKTALFFILVVWFGYIGHLSSARGGGDFLHMVITTCHRGGGREGEDCSPIFYSLLIWGFISVVWQSWRMSRACSARRWPTSRPPVPRTSGRGSGSFSSFEKNQFKNRKLAKTSDKKAKIVHSMNFFKFHAVNKR